MAATERMLMVALGLAIGAAGIVLVSQHEQEQPSSVAMPPAAARVTHVVDGDTVVLASGDHVRLIGIDTPERDACGYHPAADALRSLVEGRKVTLVNPESVQDEDRYGRLLRYVDRSGRDAGHDLLRQGLAVARYDSTDGYDHHPRQRRYRATDRAVPSLCR